MIYVDSSLMTSTPPAIYRRTQGAGGVHVVVLLGFGSNSYGEYFVALNGW